MTTKLRYDYKLLKSICDDGGVTLLIDYKDTYVTRDTRIIGKCILCEKSFDKSLNMLHKQKNYGCLSCAKILKTERIKGTMFEKYGVEHAAQSEIFRDKMKQTTFARYGVENALQSEEVKTKIRQTNLETYGCEYGLQNEEVKNKKKATYLKNYGVENPMQCKEIQDKTKLTNLEKYGVEHASQNSDILDKMTKSMYKSKDYILPSGNILQIQGYEHYALDYLLQTENVYEDDIITGCKNVPTIWYTDHDGKKRRHFVDIFIPNQNRCVEVKSTWTAHINKETIFLKQLAAKELGYNYEIWVYDAKGQITNKYC
jgi:hypothetical protein